MEKRRHNGGEDRLSALPENVLTQILSLLPFETAVATSTLSHRWRRLYTRVPSLTFHVPNHTTLNNATMFWNKFNKIVSKLASPLSVSLTLHLDLSYFLPYWWYMTDSWFRQVCGPHMEIIRITASSRCTRGDYYCYFTAPATCIFHMPSLRVLELGNFFTWTLPSNTSIFLPKLERLSIHVCSSQFHLFGKLISSIPLLEHLDFWVNRGPFNWPDSTDYSDDDIIGVDHITLTCPNLKRLYARVYNTRLRTSVIIDAPKLQFLDVASDSSKFYFVERLDFLVKARIREWSCDSRSSVFDLLEGVSRVRHLVLEKFDKCGALSFPNLIRLVIRMTWNSSEAMEQLLFLLKGCPILETLTLNFEPAQNGCKGWVPPDVTPRCMLTNVKIIELNITYYKAENTLKLVKCLLRNASVLDQLKIKFSQGQSFRTVDEDILFLNELVESQKQLLHCHIDYSSSELKVSCVGSNLLEKLRRSQPKKTSLVY